MRYGRLYYANNPANIGDEIHTLAVDALFRAMGIPEEEVLKVEMKALETYDGEYVVVPMQFHFDYVYGKQRREKGWTTFPTSPKILPVYLGFSTSAEEYAAQADHLRRFEPIGCRDEYTMQLLRRNNVQAFMTGCLSLTLPRREKPPAAGRIFVVDVPSGVLEHIPRPYLDRADFLSHMVTFEDEADLWEQTRSFARARLERYAAEAELVITNRVHCAAPCLAMGIPVVFVTERAHASYSWLDRFTPIYTPDRFAEIDWNPAPVAFEELKERMLRVASERLRSTFESYRDLVGLSESLEMGSRRSFRYFEREPYPVFDQIAERDRIENRYLVQALGILSRAPIPATDLVIFGAGSEGRLLCEELDLQPVHFRSTVFLDNNPDLQGRSCCGRPVQHPDHLRDRNWGETLVVLAGCFADEMAAQLERDYGLSEEVHFWKSYRIFNSHSMYGHRIEMTGGFAPPHGTAGVSRIYR